MIRSSFQPSASAIIEIDSASPTWRTLPSSTLLLELLARQPGADLLLERQPADARVLDAVDADRLDPLADAGQRDRQRVHHEAGVDAGAEHRDLRLLRQLRGSRARSACSRLVG